MNRRLVQVLVALGLVVPLLAPALSAHAGPADRPAWLSVPRWFSPNGDGVDDTALVRFTLAAPADRITLTFRTGRSGWADDVRRSVLKDLDAGPHTWTWNGRDDDRKVIDDAEVEVILQGDSGVTAADRTQVDTTFAPEVRVATTYGAGEDATPTVWPRSTAVIDVLGLVADLNQRTYVVGSPVRDARLEIRDRSGRLVLRTGVNRTIDDGNDKGREIGWTAVRGGRPLPKGRYVARVTGGDQVGNRGRSAPLRIWVSGDRLEWEQRTATVVPAESIATNSCNGSGCADFQPCGSVVPSARFDGGLSYRSVECTGDPRFHYPLATRLHTLPVPAAAGVRGIDRARVGFTGTPTVDGETDQGELSVSTGGEPHAAVTSSTGGATPWADDLLAGDERVLDDGNGGDLSLPPEVLWTFTTEGTDSVDVDRFTVTYRLLVPVR